MFSAECTPCIKIALVIREGFLRRIIEAEALEMQIYLNVVAQANRLTKQHRFEQQWSRRVEFIINWNPFCSRQFEI